MKYLRISALLLSLCIISAILMSCAKTDETASDNSATAANTTQADLVADGTVTLTLDGLNYTVSDSTTVTVENNVIVIIKGGTYEVSGTLTDGQLRVRVDKSQQVNLILKGVTMSCSTSAPLYVETADKVVIELTDGTVNTFTDGTSYVYPAADVDKPNACIYSDEDLTIKGTGTLIVNANYNNGIGSKNDLKIKGGTITVSAVKNALKGNDSLTVEDGVITVTSARDGLKSDGTGEGEGIVTVTGGTVSIICSDDGIQAEQGVVISGGTVTVSCGSLTVNCDGTQNIKEGCLITK